MKRQTIYKKAQVQSSLTFPVKKKSQSTKFKERAAIAKDSCLEVCTEIPREVNYSAALQRSKTYFQLAQGYFAISDCDIKGSLLKTYRILELKPFSNKQGETAELFLCDCNISQYERLAFTSSIVTENIKVFKETEKKRSCLHCIEAYNLWKDATLISNKRTSKYDLTSDTETSDNEIIINQLSLEPLHVAVFDGTTYGIITTWKSEFKCTTCRESVTSCSHVKDYKTWLSQNELEEAAQGLKLTANDSSKFISVSKTKIPYPLPDSLREKFASLEEHNTFPQSIIPPESSHKCAHGNTYSAEDPVLNKWIITRTGKLHKKYHTIYGVTVYYRPTANSKCDCKQYYDGYADLLFNMDNHNFFYYGWLFDILHDTQETRYPLAAGHRSSARTRNVCGVGNQINYKTLRLAYNSFLRLLDFDMKTVFRCEICGSNPSTIIMDGIMMGCRQDLLPLLGKDDDSAKKATISGCLHEDRVLIKSAKARHLLATYAGLRKGRYLKNLQPFSSDEFEKLLCLLNCCEPVARFVESLGLQCPEIYRKLLGELSRGSPTCGIFQIAHLDTVIQSIKSFALRKYSVKDPKQVHEVEEIQHYAPIIGELLLKSSSISGELSNLLIAILESVKKPFIYPLPQDSCYNSPSYLHEYLEFFPNFPCIRGLGHYVADEKKGDDSGCRKLSHKHAKLSPGLFTLFCSHGICLGFQVMSSPESPRTAFDILTCRFKILPSLIIYDNACKLHIFALNREPKRFHNCRFMVDRLHYRVGHTACTQGYCMDTYSADDSIRTINSQINEQANSSLRRLQTQITYMSPENMIKHISVFLAIRNMDNMKQISNKK